MNHPWLEYLEKISCDGQIVSRFELECMKYLAEHYYKCTDRPYQLGEAIKCVEEFCETSGEVEWVWFTGYIASCIVGRAMTMMNLITGGSNGGPSLGEYVLVDMRTDPFTIVPQEEWRDVFGTEREDYTGIAYTHTEHTLREMG